MQEVSLLGAASFKYHGAAGVGKRVERYQDRSAELERLPSLDKAPCGE
jgi:hypothetical protein